MSSKIDPTVIHDDQKVAKSDLRTQLTTAKNEISAIQLRIGAVRGMLLRDSDFDTV